MKAKGITRHIPNFLTSMNILAGCVSIVLSLEDPRYMIFSALCIGIASVFDFLDGMTARALKAYSAIGKELDSLADMISFGLAPAVIMYQLQKAALLGMGDFCLCKLRIDETIVLFSSFLIAIFSGLRLAKFNVDTRQSESFIGLATPPNAILIASIPVILYFYPNVELYKEIFLNSYVLFGATIILSYLLIAEFPMFSLKFKHVRFQGNKIRYTFLGLSAVFLSIFQFVGIPIVILLYVLLSAINNWMLKKEIPEEEEEE